MNSDAAKLDTKYDVVMVIKKKNIDGMKMMKLYIILSLVFLSLSILSNGKTDSELLSAWEDQIEKIDKSDGIKTICSATLEMPKFYGNVLSKKQKNQDLERKREAIFDKLKNIIIEEFLGKTEVDIAYIKDLLLLEQKLNEEQGYKNKALSVTVGALARWCVVKRVVDHPEDVKKLSLLLERRNKAVIFDPLATMKTFAVEDGQMANQEQLVIQALNSEKVIQARKISSYAVYKVLQEILPVKLRPESIFISSEGFLFTPSIYKIERMEAVMEASFRSTLPGLLRYIEKEGDIKKLSSDDVTEFVKVMGKEEWNYKFKYLSIRSLSVTRLENLIEGVTQKNAKERYLKNLGLTEVESDMVDEAIRIEEALIERQKKIVSERRLVKVDSASGVIADKLRNVSSAVEVKGGEIYLTIKANDFEYLVTEGVHSILVPLNLGQEVVLQKGFDAVAFKREGYTLRLTKKFNNYYLLEEFSTDKPSTDLEFKILDDNFELITLEKADDVIEEKPILGWLIWSLLGLIILLILALYKKKKPSHS